jgi:threonine aldolase
MRQAGILAAAGLIALHDMPGRLSEDHANARLLAEAVAAEPNVEIDLGGVQTNIVVFTLRNRGDAGAFAAALKEKGVLASTTGPHTMRLVTHYDVDRAACERAALIVCEQLRLI